MLAGYPDAVDPGCWQLLAAIDAQLAGDPDLAGYHYAWFTAWFAARDSGTPGR